MTNNLSKCYAHNDGVEWIYDTTVRNLNDVTTDILALEKESDGLIAEILNF